MKEGPKVPGLERNQFDTEMEAFMRKTSKKTSNQWNIGHN